MIYMNAVVTGASKGIGKAIAEKLVMQGMNVAICARNEHDLAQAVKTLNNINPDVDVFSQVRDLSINGEAIAFGEDVQQRFGRVDLLVNNAGTFIPGDLCTEEDGVLEKLIATNLYSAYHLTRTLATYMKQHDVVNNTRGHIVTISSVAALKAYANGGSYSISKYALEGFSKNLREELKPHLIKVSTVNPGATMSDSWSGSNVDENRIMRPQDIADIIWMLFNLSPQTVVEEIVLRPQLGDL
jgi:short-subunit dehydrogenase